MRASERERRCRQTLYPKEEDMPNGVFPVPRFRPDTDRDRPRRSNLGTRLRTWRQQARLDEQLASGADPASSSELALRATQLQSAAVRDRLANSLEDLLGRAHGPNLGAFTPAGHRR